MHQRPMPAPAMPGGQYSGSRGEPRLVFETAERLAVAANDSSRLHVEEHGFLCPLQVNIETVDCASGVRDTPGDKGRATLGRHGGQHRIVCVRMRIFFEIDEGIRM